MKFLIYDRETGVVAKLVDVPDVDYLHLNNTNEDSYVQVVGHFLEFNNETNVTENGGLQVLQDGVPVDVVVADGYHGHYGDEQ